MDYEIISLIVTENFDRLIAENVKCVRCNRLGTLHSEVKQPVSFLASVTPSESLIFLLVLSCIIVHFPNSTQAEPKKVFEKSLH